MATFNKALAKSWGYSDQEINDFMKSQPAAAAPTGDALASYGATPPTSPVTPVDTSSYLNTPSVVPNLPASPQVASAQTQTTLPQVTPQPEQQDLLSTIGEALLGPLKKGGRLVSEAANILPDILPMLQGKPLPAYKPKYMTQQEYDAVTKNGFGGATTEGLRTGAGAASYAVPGGSTLKGALALGALRGGMSGASTGDTFDPLSVAAGAAGGSAGGGLGYGIGAGANALGGAVSNQGANLGALNGKLPEGALQQVGLLGGGTALGAGLGFMKSKDKMGAIGGALVGLGLTAAARDPRIVSAVADVLTKGGDTLATSKLPSAVAAVIPQIGAAVGVGTKNFLADQPVQTSNELPPPPTSLQTSTATTPTTNVLSDVSAQPQDTLTGATPKQIYAAMRKAQAAGDKGAVAQLRQMWTDENSYQADLAKNNKSAQVNPKAQNALTALDQIENIAYDKSGGIKRSALVAEELSPGKSKYEAATYQLADQLLRAQTSRAPTAEQVNQYRTELFPNALLDNETTFKSKLNNIRGMLNNLYLAKPTTDLQDLLSGGGDATP